MSRIGKLPISIPDGTSVNISGQIIEAKGVKGSASMKVSDLVAARLEGGALVIWPRADLDEAATERLEANNAKGRKKITYAEALDRDTRTQWGTSRAQVSNMVEGVSTGFKKVLELVGVGYRAQMLGSNVKLALGFSHDVIHTVPEGITVTVPKATEIIIEGSDKQVVGQVAAEIRRYRPPEPYKGKGVRYKGEFVRRKEGKKK